MAYCTLATEEFMRELDKTGVRWRSGRLPSEFWPGGDEVYISYMHWGPEDAVFSFGTPEPHEKVVSNEDFFRVVCRRSLAKLENVLKL